jgi:putative ATP-dependent endonuclease of the OLD family
LRISQLTVKNFRGIKELALPMSSFGCVIGENNAGKSTVLQALDVFFNGPSLKVTDYHDHGTALEVEVTFSDIDEADLARLADEHRDRITQVVRDGQLVLSRVYGDNGKGSLRYLARIPRLERLRPYAIDALVAKKTNPELRQGAVFAHPELESVLPAKPSQKSIREAIQSLVDGLDESEFVMEADKLAPPKRKQALDGLGVTPTSAQD